MASRPASPLGRHLASSASIERAKRTGRRSHGLDQSGSALKCRYAAFGETPTRRAASRNTIATVRLPGRARCPPAPGRGAGCRGGRAGAFSRVGAVTTNNVDSVNFMWQVHVSTSSAVRESGVPSTGSEDRHPRPAGPRGGCRCARDLGCPRGRCVRPVAQRWVR
jgi:hypothetical protein